jgi:hypothetical protein
VAARGAAQQPATPVTPRESSPDPMFVRAIAAVNEKLKHPQSARYGDMVRKVGPNVNGRPAEVVCGKRKRKRLFPQIAHLHISSRMEPLSWEGQIPILKMSPKSSMDVSASSMIHARPG